MSLHDRASISALTFFKTSGCSLSSLFRDKTGLWRLSQSQINGLGGVSNLENILSGDDATQWLVLVKIGGLLEV